MWDRDYCRKQIDRIEAKIAAAASDDVELVTGLWHAHDVWCEMYATCNH